jgi:hypothetical protein
MHPNWDVTAWALIGALGFATLGALFGAVVRVAACRSGTASGGRVGRAAVLALERLAERSFSPVARSALGGAADGAAFLGTLGAGIGLAAGSGRLGPGLEVLFVVFAAVALLLVSALLLNALGHWLRRTGSNGVAVVFLAGVGVFVGHCLDVPYGKLSGLLAGIGVGLLAVRFDVRDDLHDVEGPRDR